MEKPPVLSDDWDNNLYRNVVHVLAECENMIPGGQAERVIEVCDALYGEKIKQARQDTAREIFEDIESLQPFTLSNYFKLDGIGLSPRNYQSLKSKYLIPPNPVGSADL